jgi:hypothetical protein
MSLPGYGFVVDTRYTFWKRDTAFENSQGPNHNRRKSEQGPRATLAIAG